MRTDLDFDGGAEAPAFTLSCPGYRPGRARPGAAPPPGRLSFMIGNDVVAEIGHGDLMSSWQAASALSASEAFAMSETAGKRLAEIVGTGLNAADLTEAVTDAAVVFLLAMCRFGIKDPKRIPACTVMWNGQEERGHVVLGA
ncbi:MAG: hypothetical protein HYX36_01115 [Rhizobiales bacterium]|nr:hypothetical protein [Hyphomicrobiales bacterium]